MSGMHGCVLNPKDVVIRLTIDRTLEEWQAIAEALKDKPQGMVHWAGHDIYEAVTELESHFDKYLKVEAQR